MSQNGHEERSGAEREGATNATSRALPAWSIPRERRPRRGPQQPPLPLLVHLAPPQSRALPHLQIRPVCPTDQRHGHRQYLRTSRQATFLCRRMGAKYPLLSRSTSDGSSSSIKTRLVRTFCPQRVPVFHAPTRGSVISRRRSPRVANGGRPRGGFYGPHQDLPRASGEAESPPRRLGRVFLSESDRPLHNRRLRLVRRPAHREPPREVPMCTRRVLPKSVPQPTDPIRKTPPATTLIKDSQLTSHRTTILRPTSRENADRDPHKGHATVREFLLLALYGDHVTYNVATAGSGLIHALRLPAVSAEPALRPVPEVPA